MTQPQYFSASEVAQILQLSPQTVTSLGRSGELEGSFVKRKWLFTVDAVTRYVNNNRRGR